MSSSWERVAVTRMCATCAREFEHTPNPNGGRHPSRCPKCSGEAAPKKRTASVTLVTTMPGPIAVVAEPAPPLHTRSTWAP